LNGAEKQDPAILSNNLKQLEKHHEGLTMNYEQLRLDELSQAMRESKAEFFEALWQKFDEKFSGFRAAPSGPDSAPA
jgi:hypothetical protein